VANKVGGDIEEGSVGGPRPRAPRSVEQRLHGARPPRSRVHGAGSASERVRFSKTNFLLNFTAGICFFLRWRLVAGMGNLLMAFDLLRLFLFLNCCDFDRTTTDMFLFLHLDITSGTSLVEMLR
jgi:hypothetical protein